MGVLTEYQAVVSCDYCGENLTEAYWTQKQIIKEARGEGWSIGKTVKCPKCRRKEEVDEQGNEE